VPALQTSELALDVALRILAIPDPFVPLRRRVAVAEGRTVGCCGPSGSCQTGAVGGASSTAVC
jgi:hypothetical protein